MYYTVSYCQSL